MRFSISKTLMFVFVVCLGSISVGCATSRKYAIGESLDTVYLQIDEWQGPKWNLAVALNKSISIDKAIEIKIADIKSIKNIDGGWLVPIDNGKYLGGIKIRQRLAF